MLPVSIKTQLQDINQVRIVPRKGYYVVEVIYEKEVKQASVNPAFYAGIDIGLIQSGASRDHRPDHRRVLHLKRQFP